MSPALVAIFLGLAVVADWARMIPEIAYFIAGMTVVAAIVLWVRKALPIKFKSKEQLGFKRNRDWAWYEATGHGMPRLFYPLVALCLLGIFGIDRPYGYVAGACLLLTFTWGLSKRQWPPMPA
jgi:hypothetical protein